MISFNPPNNRDEGLHNEQFTGPSAPYAVSAVAAVVQLPPFTVKLDRPADWREAAELKGHFPAAWTSQSGSEVLVLGHGPLAHGVKVEDVAAAPIQNVIQAGFRVPVVMALPVIMQDGSSAYSINYPYQRNDVEGFKYAYLKERDGFWFSMEFMAHGRKLDLPELAARFGTLLGTFSVER